MGVDKASGNGPRRQLDVKNLPDLEDSVVVDAGKNDCA